ncbi:MAG: alkyl hydroperoxide reductase/Thiol specific antioxidant/Mal allergen [Gemmatimonadetes bacterium]|nr:alkyl hydroperoxide reductase/Thiol specific antioxidant/Mal allergen [Gemmatimonadota bacterium]
MRRLHPSLLAAMLLSVAPYAARAQTAAPAATVPAGPDVGQVAPDFTAAWADGSGARPAPVSLAALRGKVVVIAFYPKDRTSGCTAELTKFRDQYATLFGSDVVVLPVSADSIVSHVAWASEMKFPFALVSDPQLTTADLYGSHVAGRPAASRTVYVVGKDGKVAWREMKFNALNEESYTALAAAVAKAR